MRTACFALAAMAFSLVGDWSIATSQAQPAAQVSDSPSWAPDTPDQAFGFAPVTVTQSGATYAPTDPAASQPDQNAPSLGDLPALASTSGGVAPAHDPLADLGLRKFGSLPEWATWTLLLAGFAIIGGALRGLILANRRLRRLREPDEVEDE